MRHFNIYLSLALAMILAGTTALAQQTLQYRLNTYNGLPSDNVYCMIRDRYGYLWIGTDRGVVKYNGYNYKVFDARNGLSYPDVWDFFEDRKGRIWLSRITDEIGYILNDVYHSADNDDSSHGLLYPRYIRNFKDGIVFLSTVKSSSFLFTESGGKLSHIKLARLTSTDFCFISEAANPYHYEGGYMFRLKTEDGKVSSRKTCRAAESPGGQLLGNYIVNTVCGGAACSISMIHIDSCTIRSIPMGGNDFIYNQYRNRDKYYIVTGKRVFIFDSLLNKYICRPLDTYLSRTQLKDNQVAYVMQDSLWGNCIATTNGGFFMSYALPHFNKPTTEYLAKYKHVGTGDDNTHYWWNEAERKLCVMSKDYTMRCIAYDSIKKIDYITEYGDGRLLMFSEYATALLRKKDFSIQPLAAGMKYYDLIYHPDTFHSKVMQFPQGINHILPASIGGRVDKNGMLHLISRGNGYQTVQFSNDTIVHQIYTTERYRGIVYLPVWNKYILYGEKHITIGSGGNLTHISEASLNAAGINGIENIIADPVFSNIFISTITKVFMFNPHTFRLSEIRGGYNTEQAQILVHNGQLITGGKGGVICRRIIGPGRLSIPVFYPNTKALAYRNLYTIVPACDSILLNTDFGLLSLKIPGAEEFRNTARASQAGYRLVLKSHTGFSNLAEGDTIRLQPGEGNIILDLVKPTGVGNLKFWYSIEEVHDKMQEARAREIQTAAIASDQYYTMTIRAGDDTWLSPDINVVLYRIPTFWQTAGGKALVWGTLFISGLLIILFTIYYTRKIVSASHLKKNYLLSLELKAIHAQINPHFIFNTLNTGLYFISENRNKEAYEHISSFSELLRSYIKSARNKYIPLAEEMDNLENYIKLQQQRFEDKFSYSISADDTIHTETTLIPSLLLQPFVENAIHHGLLNSDKTGHLSIKFVSANQGNELICIIDDNGVGREQSARINSENPNKPYSYGNTLIADLVKVVNTDGRLNISIKYIDKTGRATGTTVIITIKKVHHDE